MWIPTSTIQVVAPILLTLTVLSLWLAPRAWPTLLVLTFLTGCASGQLTWLAGLCIILLAGACYAYALVSGEDTGVAEDAEVEQMAIAGDDEGGFAAERTNDHVVIVGIRADGGFDRRTMVAKAR
jgi:hypothetical protein